MASQIRCGSSVTPFSDHYSGKTVSELRRVLRSELNIPDGAPVNVIRDERAEPVDDSYTLRDGEVLEFVRTSGRKG